MELATPLTTAPQQRRTRLELRVVELAAVRVSPGIWLPGPGDPATLRAMQRLRAVGYVLGGGAADETADDTLLDPFLVDGRLQLVYGGDWLAALRNLGETHAQVLVAEGLPEDRAFRLLLAHLLRPIPPTATPMQIHRAEQPIRALIAEAAKARQRRAGQQTAAGRWGARWQETVASANSPEAVDRVRPTGVPSALSDVLERALESVTSRGDTRSKHRLLGLTSSVDEYEAIEKIIQAASDASEAAAVRAVAAAQLAALDTAQPPAVSTALRRVHEARHDARAHALGAGAARAARAGEAPGARDGDLVEAVVATLQDCVERLDTLLSPRSVAAKSISRAGAGARRLRAAADAAREIPELLASVAEAL